MGFGYRGSYCEVDVNECIILLMFCFNGGMCWNSEGFYKCVCLVGYNGNICEVNINECVSDLCIYNGWCVDFVNGFYCSCIGIGYKGFCCDINVDECEIGEYEC